MAKQNSKSKLDKPKTQSDPRAAAPPPARDVFADDDDAAKEDPMLAAYGVVGWWNGSIDAGVWWQIVNLAPRKAAMLLCQLNPNRTDADPSSHDNGETASKEFARLLVIFEDLAQTDTHARTLKEWRDIAKARGLKYHSWIDEYEQAMQLVQKDVDDRRSAGRRTLDEVATELASQSGEAKKVWQGRIVEQVKSGKLRLKNPEDYRDPLPQAIPQGTHTYDLVSVHEVNAWLAANPELGNFRLGDTASESNTKDNKQLPAGATSSDIVSKFKLSDAWDNKLRHVNSYGYLKPALMRRGSRKSGNKTGASHLWNPVQFAEILIKRDGKSPDAMARIIENRFPKWQDEWNAAQAIDESNDWDNETDSE